MANTHLHIFGVTVVPKLNAKGEPVAQVTIVSTTADSVTELDAEGAEIAFGYADGEFHVVDYRGADAVSG